MRYLFFFKKTNKNFTNYKYRLRHLVFKNSCPKELLHAFKSINRTKLIIKLSKLNVDHIEMIGFLLDKLNNDLQFRKKMVKSFKREKVLKSTSNTKPDKKILTVEKLSENLSEIYNFEFKQEDINTYDKLF